MKFAVQSYIKPVSEYVAKVTNHTRQYDPVTDLVVYLVDHFPSPDLYIFYRSHRQQTLFFSLNVQTPFELKYNTCKAGVMNVERSTELFRVISHLSLGYICPDHRTIFRSAIFSTIFRHRRRSWATTYVLTIHTGIVQFLDLPFVDVLIQKRKAICTAVVCLRR